MTMAVTFGLDISHHQPLSLDLAQCRRDGCELCLIKAGEGSTYLDPDFASNLAEARAAGMLTAAYWYVLGNTSAAAHVDRIIRTVPPDVAIIPDVEAGSGGIALVMDIINRLRAAGYVVPLIYLPRWYWQQLGTPSLAGLPPLWSSRYPDNVVGLLASEWATVPASYWDGYGGIDVGLLQFTSSARIGGYAPLDASAFRGTRDQLAALLYAPVHPASSPTRNDEESIVEMPAGDHVRRYLFAAGRPHCLWWQVGEGHKVIVHEIEYIRRTPDGMTRGDYGPVGDPGYPTVTVFDADRPGPVEFANDVAFVSVKYSCDAASVAAIG